MIERCEVALDSAPLLIYRSGIAARSPSEHFREASPSILISATHNALLEIQERKLNSIWHATQSFANPTRKEG